MSIRVKRIYEKISKDDGPRILIDRLWPRGITKAKARITDWPKDLAPSNELRMWFHEDREHRFADFQKKYRAELRKGKAKIKADMSTYGHSYTLVTAVKDIEHSHAPVLLKFLETL